MAFLLSEILTALYSLQGSSTLGHHRGPPLAECEELAQTDPDGSQMATNNLSCPHPTKGAQTSDDFLAIYGLQRQR